MEKTDLKTLDKKLDQVCTLMKEFRDLQQAVMLKKGIIDDMVKDIMMTEMKYPEDANFTMAELMQKVRAMSRAEASGLVLP